MRSATVIAALILSLSLIGAAAAQANASGTGGTGGGLAETAQSTGRVPADFDAFLATFSDPDFSSVIGAVGTSMHFNVVKLSGLAPSDASKLQEVITPPSEALTELRHVLAESDGASAALAAEGASVNQVVWVAGEGEFMMHLYVTDF